MLAFVGLFAGEVFPHPFFNGEITGPAIYQFQQTYTSSFPAFWIFLVSLIGAIEAKSINKNWIPLAETAKQPSGLAKLRSTAIPGDLGFDPLGNSILILNSCLHILILYCKFNIRIPAYKTRGRNNNQN